MKTFADLKFTRHPIAERGNGDGLMAKEHFQNGYGVSVVRFKMPGGMYGSYTNNESEWEVAVLKDGQLCYDTPVTNDVLRRQSEDDVTRVMRAVQELP